MPDVPIHLIDRIKARLVAALDREVYNYRSTEATEAYTAIVRGILTIRVSYHWNAIYGQDEVEEVWDALSANLPLRNVILNVVPDVKEEILYSPSRTAEGHVYLPEFSISWKQFCDSLAESFCIKKPSKENPEWLRDHVVVSEEFSRLLMENPWLVVILILARVHPKLLIDKLNIKEDSDGRYPPAASH